MCDLSIVCKKLLRAKASLVDILIAPSIVTVDVLIVLSPTMLYGAQRTVLLLGMSTLQHV